MLTIIGGARRDFHQTNPIFQTSTWYPPESGGQDKGWAQEGDRAVAKSAFRAAGLHGRLTAGARSSPGEQKKRPGADRPFLLA
ncbi:hypothetical protein [Microvirgula aerodenitrificans]|uniref:hypothetical protein n=1 Tax=Microvirgula aerodenitrificans TaxID=57480 RepID=UPI00248E96A7|nr:hypothetical protein [Microvirgula aerodenitrificans]